ncbi:hypothetical protein [Paraburkholderia phenoliruptrix]|uniref:hypothetical protein n=1 Tax=Paraburkholderia phenoliruptrix TaxID=252970 RepID=UPI001C4E62EE|nr:hypothetical protein [Paraburkholderia phenoliruptrix]MBW0450856.1 hypothetical protein [Paraburkholderia phenoliruptrix]MBW9100949.1 hypothetical protein [Paraburkholderia phenoliruptrix]
MSIGGAAFPVPEVLDGHGQVKSASEAGMTLRDYFAAAALPPLIAKAAGSAQQPGKSWFDVVAESAYAHADAMIKARGQ